VASGNDVDVFRTLVLQGKTNSGKLPGTDNPAQGRVFSLGDLVVLAKDAAQITARNKNSP
jgi:hypothetical protein